MAEGEAVKVAVRVRPFNGREQAMDAKLCIRMSGPTTYIKDLEGDGEEKDFTFDYSYWSFDKFKDEEGMLIPTDPTYADQDMVFNDVGLGIKQNSWDGFNCSLFAYGQTGSGKSYSIIGYGPNKGVVPLYCADLFKEIEQRNIDTPENEYQVQFSMLEIYNENVFDLLIKGKRTALKIRQSKARGFFVQGLKKQPVGSYADIESKMAEGTANRTVASTKMNATSSRAHTVVELTLTQKIKAGGANVTKTSVVNLVDLAGSERASSTGASGDTLKQGAAINKSLSSLGNVIAALAKQSENPKSRIVIPFRDSSLTMILKNALGGNSKTIMIAALSPASVNYEETLGTLRFADRAKQIKCKATVNESPTDKLIRELKEENEKLKKMMEGGAVDRSMLQDDDDDSGLTDEELQAQIAAIMEQNEAQVNGMEQEWESKLKAAQDAIKELEAEKNRKQEMMKTVPHLSNINADEQLQGMIIHFLEDGKTVQVGAKGAEPPNDMVLSGLQIEQQHCTIECSGAKISVTVGDEAKVYVNGENVSGKIDLMHSDRMLFGANNLFSVEIPAEREAGIKAGLEYYKFTFHDAMAEIQNLGQTNDSVEKGEAILQEDLSVIGPMVGEVNAMSCALDKKVKFEIVIMPEEGNKRKTVMVNEFSFLTQCSYILSREEFINRKYKMQEMYEMFVNSDDSWKTVPDSEDPFTESDNKDCRIGSVSVSLKSLGYLFEQEQTLTITNYNGTPKGELRVEYFPCKADGAVISEDDDIFVDDPDALVGQPLNFLLKVPYARGIDKRYRDVFIKYKFFLNPEEDMTEKMTGVNPEFNYTKQITVNPVSDQFVDYLERANLILEVWGNQIPVPMKEGDMRTTKQLMSANVNLSAANVALMDPEKQAIMGELDATKRRAQKQQDKLCKIQDLIESAVAAESETISVADLQKVLESNAAALGMAVAVFKMKTRKSKEEGTLFKDTAKALAEDAYVREVAQSKTCTLL